MVIDASAVVDAMLHADDREALLRLTAEHELVAPELLDSEFASSVIRMARLGTIAPQTARAFIDNIAWSPIRRVSQRALLPDVWRLRESFSAYDAFYVALALRLDATLVTTDAPLIRACEGVVPTTPLASMS